MIFGYKHFPVGQNVIGNSCMKFFFLPFFLAVLALPGLAQQPKASSKKAAASKAAGTAATVKKPSPKHVAKKDEKTELEKALAVENAEQKAAALSKFLADFPSSESRVLAAESLTSARVAAAQAKFEAGDRDAALKLVRLALDEAAAPYPEKLFADSISKIPMLMFSLSGAAAAHESAAAIEKNSASSVPQLLSLAGFHLNLENGADAKRLAEAAIKLDEKSAPAFQTLGMANRLNFDLDAAAAAFEKAVELDPESVAARQSLAEMKRAAGKPDEAIAIFSALIEKDPNDLRSVNGRILSLYDAGKRTEADALFAKAIEAEPGNFVLLSGAAYWHAANGEHAKAVDLASKAIAAEPRYIWSHIALARGLAGEGRMSDAEQVLLTAKKYGNFPTLDYELAATKFNAGFYREAAEELQKSFAVRDGALVTKLGRRIERSDKNFIDLLSAERRASISEPKAADSLQTTEKMRALLEFASILNEKTPDETIAAASAATFAEGADKMRFHRQLFAASQLAERSLSPTRTLELTKAAVASADDGLSVPMAAAPIMAGELYQSRTAAIATGKYVLVPEVSKQAISAIARGRIEELAGMALMQLKNNAEAAVRLRRAISILPEKSAWWRSSNWRLGTVLEAEGKDKEALEAYAKSYTSSEPNAEKYAAIESVYKRVNNGTEGLEALVGANPAQPVEKKAEDSPPLAEAKTDTKTEDKIKISNELKTEPATEKKAEAIETNATDKPPVPPAEKANQKVTGYSTEQTATKQASEGKAPEQKPPSKVEESKPVESESKPAEVPTIKSADKEKPSAEPGEKTEKANDTKPPAANESQTVPTKTEEPKTELKAGESKTGEPRAAEASPTPKPLFEPVVIEIKTSKPTKAPAAKTEDRPLVSETKDESSGASRARLVTGKEIGGDAGPVCAIWISQDSITLTRGKGRVGILVGAENGDVKEVKYRTNSPENVDIVHDSEAVGVNGRALFVVRSLTETTGEYKVSFELPCGRKDVQVRVR